MSPEREAQKNNGKPSMNGMPSALKAALIAELLSAGAISHKVDVSEVEKTDTKKIIIPDTMSKLEAAHELERQHEEEESIVSVSREFANWDYKDTLVAIKNAMTEHFGWVDAKTVHTFFGPRRPQFIEVTTNIVNGVPSVVEAFYGKTEVSAWEDAEFNIAVRNASSVQVSFELKKKYKASASEFFDKIQAELKANSIYRAKSLVITKSERGGVEYGIFENKPSDKIFLNEGNEMVIRDFVVPDLLEPGKRAYLFTGNFGTGKTETAMKLGHTGNENGMSFIYLKDSELLEQVILLAQNYSPCILFLEDLDEVAAGERGADINHILNTLDGVQSKKADLKMIFTTNNEDKINSAFRRPGRIDQIVKFDNPNTDTKKKIVSSYVSGFEGFTELDLDKAVSHFPDAQGAVIAEISKRIARLSTKNGSIREDYFLSASASMEPQLDLMNKDAKVEKPTVDKLFAALIKENVEVDIDALATAVANRI